MDSFGRLVLASLAALAMIGLGLLVAGIWTDDRIWSDPIAIFGLIFYGALFMATSIGWLVQMKRSRKQN